MKLTVSPDELTEIIERKACSIIRKMEVEIGEPLIFQAAGDERYATRTCIRVKKKQDIAIIYFE